MYKSKSTKKMISWLSCVMALLMVISSFPFTSGLIKVQAADEPIVEATFTVVDTINEPVKNADVNVYSDLAKTDELDSAKTDENGTVAFELDEMDVYYYTVSAKNMFDSEGTFTKTETDKNVEMVYSVKCKTCDAKGSLDCPLCNGTGTIPSTESCTDCTDGVVATACPDCTELDRDSCETCNGTGFVDEDCATCNGTGEVSVENTCTKCSGTKEIECTECNGNKYVEAYDDFKFEFDSNPSIIYRSKDNANPVNVTKSNGEISYSSSDESVVTVDNSGKLTAKGRVGKTATITAKIGFDKENGYAPKIATCTVSIIKRNDFIQEFNIANNLVYTGKSQELVTPKDDGDVDLDSLTIEIYDSKGNKVENAIDADTYKVIVSDNNYNASTTNVTISKAVVTVVPGDKSNPTAKIEKVVGETLDSYTIDYYVDGEQNNEKVVLEGSLTYEKANGDDEEIGDSYPITQGTVKLTADDINKNYELAFDDTKVLNIIDFSTDAKATVKDINSAANKYWFNKTYIENNASVVITAPEGYKISTKPNRVIGADWNDQLTVSADGNYDNYRYYLKETATGKIAGKGNALTVSFGIDTICPKADYVEFDLKNDNLLASIGRTLTFGTFFNTRIEAKVTSSDERSGVKSVSLVLKNGEEVYSFDNADGKFVLSNSADPITGQAFVTVVDEAGNKNYNNNGDELVVKDDKKSNIANNDCFIMIENEAPSFSDIVITPDDSNRDTEYTYNEKNVYSGDVSFTLTASDNNSGLYYSEMSINGKDLSVGPYADKTPSAKYVLSTKGIKANEDGSYVLKITTSDAAGNTASTTETIFVDRHAPIVKSFDIKGIVGTKDDNSIPHAITLTEYGFYFKDEAEVTVTFGDYAEENELLSGLSTAKIYLLDKDGTIYQVTQDGKTTSVNKTNEPIKAIDEIEEIALDAKLDKEGNSIATFTFKVDKNFKGQIYAMAIDNARNTLVNVDGDSTPTKADEIIGEKISFDTTTGYQKPNGSIIENTEKHNESYKIEISTPDTKKVDYDGTPLYNDPNNQGIDVDLVVEDTYSGIKSIEVDVTAPYNTDENFNHIVTVGEKATADSSLTYNEESNREKDWKIVETEENIATKMTNTINITNNSNDIVITVTLTDRAGNVSVSDYTISLDKSAPEIEVVYNNNVKNTVGGRDYYQDERTATVTIRELNLVDPSQIVVTATRDGDDSIAPSEYTLSDLIKETYKSKKLHKTIGTDGTETEYYEFIFTIPGNVQGDYDITVASTDNAGNKDEYTREDIFSVDTIAPSITVVFDNDKAENGNYFGTKRKATVTVTDRYFNSATTTIDIKSADNGKTISNPVPTKWSKQNDKYEQSCEITFEKDATYSFTVDTTDMSGKAATQYKVSDFVIDNTDPTIKITINKEAIKNGSNQAYIEDVVPQVVVEDTNFSQTDTKVTLTPAVYKEGTHLAYESTPISKNEKFENGMTYDYNIFKEDAGHERIYDNIYILEVSTKDKAGHTTESQKVVFSVNRYGSTYSYKLNDYYNAKPVIQIEEINVNPIDFEAEETYINVTNTSGMTKTYASKDINIQKQEASEKNWYSYLYAIPSETFESDDVYSVKLSSIDTAKRVSTNINDANKQDISFTVDTTDPYFQVTNYIENENIKESTYELVVDIMDDTSGVAKYNVLFDGKIVPSVPSYDSKNYENKITVRIPIEGATSLADAAGRKLKVEIEDAAANDNKAENGKKTEFNVRISSSFFVDLLAKLQDFYHHTVVFWCTVAGVVAVAGGIVWIVLAKKKKNKSEE